VQLEPPPDGLDLTGNGEANGDGQQENHLRPGGTPEAAKPRAS
jgi:hypothetical protein